MRILVERVANVRCITCTTQCGCSKEKFVRKKWVVMLWAWQRSGHHKHGVGNNSPEVVEAANIGDEVGGAAKLLLLPAAATFLTIIKIFRDILDASFNLSSELWCNHVSVQHDNLTRNADH